MGKVRVELWPWLSHQEEHTGFRRITLEEEVGGAEAVKDFLGRMCERHRVFREVIFDRQTQELSRQVTVIYNDRLLELVDGLNTVLHDGDKLRFLPAFAGG
ncbi:MAG: MoaD/ThiS family protein [Dehalococcoidia bacterium]|jgi:molybdopterin converting factor small subunit|nr:MoaD/ThiS family protein [Dehalococcoidia bacterium]MDP7240083.1 MoaD/ThiS family protein [Dehalococcoidia bacterium]MDP7470272.1 MoaD/ThiS family protein [Dehalococcoidia bacterium]